MSDKATTNVLVKEVDGELGFFIHRDVLADMGIFAGASLAASSLGERLLSAPHSAVMHTQKIKAVSETLHERYGDVLQKFANAE